MIISSSHCESGILTQEHHEVSIMFVICDGMILFHLDI